MKSVVGPSFRRRSLSAWVGAALFASIGGTANAQFDMGTWASGGVPRVAPGGTVSYYFSYRNNLDFPTLTTAELRATFNGDAVCSWRCEGGSYLTMGPPIAWAPYACPVPSSGTGNFAVQASSMPRTTDVRYKADCVVSPTATGSIGMVSSVPPPGGVFDPTPTNNQSTVSTPVVIWNDVKVTTTDSAATAAPGGFLRHDVVVRNAGTVTATDVRVVNDFPADETCTWTCSGNGCSAAQGVGDIDEYVDIPAYASIAYIADCDIAPSASGTLTSTANVALPAGVDDMQTEDNLAVDTTSLAPTNGSVSIGNDPNYPPSTFIASPDVANIVTWRVQNDDFSAPVTVQVALDIPPRFVNARWSCDQPGHTIRCAVRVVDDRWIVQFSMQNVFGMTLQLQTGLLDGPEDTITLTPVISVVNGTDPNPANNTHTTVVPISPSLFRNGFEIP